MSAAIKLKYNISSWDKLELNFWGIPKCGNTTVKFWLYRMEREQQNLNCEDFTEKETNSWLHDPKIANYITKEQAFNNYYSNFTVVRNPYERGLSMYKDFAIRRPSHVGFGEGLEQEEFFEKLLDFSDEGEIHFRPQSYFVTEADSREINVFKLESVFELSMIGILVGDEVVNFTPDEEIILSEKSRELIRIKYEKDFSLFGYDK